MSANNGTLSPVKVEMRSRSSRNLLSYDEVPAWYRENVHIHHGYRPVVESIRTCLESWTYIHNETVNIYSHLLPGIVAILCQGALFQYFSQSYPQAAARDRTIVAFYLCTASTCLCLSGLYHTFLNHSAHMSALWERIDFIGITILILGDFVSGIYVMFYCEPALQNTYWVMVRHHPLFFPPLFVIYPVSSSLCYSYSSH